MVIVIALAAAAYLLFREKWTLPSFASYINPFFDPSKKSFNSKNIGDSVSKIKNAVKNSAGVDYFENFLSNGKEKFEAQLNSGLGGALEQGKTLENQAAGAIKDNAGGIYKAIGDALGVNPTSSSSCR